MTSRWQGKYFFLTYSQALIDKDELFAFIKSVAPVTAVIIANELHEDGSPHAHAAIRYPKRFSTTNCRRFDFNGNHPKIEICGSWPKCVNYLRKDGDFRIYDSTGPTPDNVLPTDDADYFEIAADFAPDRNAWVNYCMRNSIQYAYMRDIWLSLTEVHARAVEHTDHQLHQSRIKHPELLDLQLPPDDDMRSMCVIGPSEAGKTSWAQSIAPQPYLLATHLDDLKHLTAHIKCIIFDDMEFSHLPRTSQIHIADRLTWHSIHCRHTIAHIPAGVMKIFLGNYFPFMIDTAIDNRLLTVHLTPALCL